MKSTNREEGVPSALTRGALPGRRWPLSAVEEALFEAALMEATDGELESPSSEEYRLVLLGLHTGVSAGALLGMLKALEPKRMLGAYRSMRGIVESSFETWGRITSSVTSDRLAEVDREDVAHCKMLIPGLHAVLSESSFGVAKLESLVHRSSSLRGLADKYMVVLADESIDAERRSAVTQALLGGPGTGGVWADSAFCPSRVTEVSSSRLVFIGQPRGKKSKSVR